MQTLKIKLDPTTEKWLNEAVKSHQKARQMDIPKKNLEILFHLGYLVGTAGQFSPTAKAYAWLADYVKRKTRKADAALESALELF